MNLSNQNQLEMIEKLFDEKLKGVTEKLENIEVIMIEMKTNVKEDSKRITVLERFKDEFVAKATIIFAIIAFGVTLLKDWLFEKFGLRN